jgi:hypothetical protein
MAMFFELFQIISPPPVCIFAVYVYSKPNVALIASDTTAPTTPLRPASASCCFQLGDSERCLMGLSLRKAFLISFATFFSFKCLDRYPLAFRVAASVLSSALSKTIPMAVIQSLSYFTNLGRIAVNWSSDFLVRINRTSPHLKWPSLSWRAIS